MLNQPTHSFFRQCQEKVLLFDGGMGSMLQTYHLTEDDFEGLEGCNEILVRTRPQVVREIHAAYFEAGSDVVETDSFGATSIVLAEYDIADQAYDLNLRAARVAKEVAQDFTHNRGERRPRFVAGSIGPTTKLPTLGHIGYDELKASYIAQVQGLIDGGADMLLIETCQDLLQTKAAIAAVHAVRRTLSRYIPTMVQVTIETTGTMLVGMDIASVVTALQPYDIDVLGMNCATGPQEMATHIRYLSHHSPFYISCLPNAGIPENVGGKAHYHLQPEELASHLQHFIKDLGVHIVGGCCGTTPKHIKAVHDLIGGLSPGTREISFEPSLTSLYSSVPMKQDPPPVLVGERTNSNGSKKFRELLAEDNYDALVDVGRQQVNQGAHLLDLCTAYVGRNEIKDMTEAVTRFNAQLDVPLMIDSTEAPVIEVALKRIAGKAIVNSINLEDGEERLETVLPLCREFGAAVVALTIDEEGMAKTAQRKLEIARRIYDLAVKKYGIPPEDIIFDTLTFTLGSGDEEFRRAGAETIEAIRMIQQEFPAVGFVLGISNISFGLKPAARHILNSVFLHYALEAGLNMAIINSAHILPLHRISEQEKELCRQLIFDERKFDATGECTYDPLMEMLAYYEANSATAVEKRQRELPEQVEERLKYRIINGEKTGLDADLNEALTRYPALEIINNILLDGMKTVGELFGKGEMQLPFVLQSAEVMKTAVALLEPHMEKVEGDHSKGTLVLATVKGDVHDIGKNLVDIILTNNGYRVINLGIKQPLETMLDALKEHKANAVGMSGLLVKSTAIMKDNLAAMQELGLSVPVILGGAALTSRFVDEDCQAEYAGKVYYARDAFSGLYAMESIMSGNGNGHGHGNGKGVLSQPAELSKVLVTPEAEPVYQAVGEISRGISGLSPEDPDYFRRSDVREDVPIPQPPFWGSKVLTNIDLNEVYPYLNAQSLIAGQWQVKRGTRSASEHEKFVQENILPVLEDLKRRAVTEGFLTPKVIYGFYPAQSERNTLLIHEPEAWQRGEKVVMQRFEFPRGGKQRLCLADYFASVDSGRMDVAAFQMVTVGEAATRYSQALFQADNYSDYLYFHGFSVEMAEALAEFQHKRVREEWGIAGSDASDIKRLFAQGYQGSRYSPGYPACPALEDQRQIFAILEPERIGIQLTEEFMLEPEQSTSALIVHHPEARYFDVR
ncbi:MAG TPA: methionine synthase [Coleofasciculaceae cyanobacterium]|jgi:5-methyltetrahydrofolate--homocysteine methyltransferase